jgi:hypothetical protein
MEEIKTQIKKLEESEFNFKIEKKEEKINENQNIIKS